MQSFEPPFIDLNANISGISADLIYSEPLLYPQYNNQDYQLALPDDFDPVAYELRVEFEPEKIGGILRELNIYKDVRRIDLVRELEKGCKNITPFMIDGYLKCDLLGSLLEMLTDDDKSIYAFTLEGTRKVNKPIVDFACSVLRCVEYIIDSLTIDTHVAHMKRILPTVHRLCRILLKLLYLPKDPSGRWSHENWEDTHLIFRPFVDDLAGALFKLTEIGSHDSEQVAKDLATLVMRSWFRGYTKELYHRAFIVSLAKRVFSEGIPLEKGAFPDGKRYSALRKVFERDLQSTTIVGAEIAAVVETLLLCLEHYPKVVSPEYVNSALFPPIRAAIERGDRLAERGTDNSDHFIAMKWLVRAVRTLLQGIPFCGGPGTDIRPLYKAPYWLYVMPLVLSRATAKCDKETFDDCRYVLALEGPQAAKITKEKDPDIYAYAQMRWEQYRTAIERELQSHHGRAGRSWGLRLSNCWNDAGKAYGFVEDKETE